jgi:hypothetical protein
MDISLDVAIDSSIRCCGVNAPNLRTLTPENVVSIRNEFLSNVSFNSAKSHQDIINVLIYMTQYV